MNIKRLPLCAALLALACFLTACGQIGIIGGADGPTTIIVGGDNSNAAETVPDAAEDAAAIGGADLEEGAEIEPPPEPAPLTLAVLSGPWAEAIKAELPVFEEANLAVCTVRELSGDELHDALAQGGDGYDLVMVHSANMPEFRDAGVLANLSALGYKADEDIVPAVTEICSDGAAVILAPWYANASVLLCNKNSLLASGSSVDQLQSLESLLAVCKAAKKRGEIGFAYHESFQDRITLDFLPVLRSFDGWFLDYEGKPSIYTKKFQDAVNFFLDLTATGKSVPNGEFVSAIDDGKAAVGFIRSDAYALSAKSAATYAYFPGAATRGGEPHSAGTCTVWGWGVPVHSQNPELAERLLEYLVNPNIERKALSSGLSPCRYSILQDEEIRKEYPHYGKLCAALENSRYVPAVTQWPQMCDILGEELWKVMAGRKKVTECLEDAQSRIESLLSQSPATGNS